MREALASKLKHGSAVRLVWVDLVGGFFQRAFALKTRIPTDTLRGRSPSQVASLGLLISSAKASEEIRRPLGKNEICFFLMRGVGEFGRWVLPEKKNRE